MTYHTKAETKLQAAIKKALEAAGFWVIRQQSSGRHGPRSVATGEPGIPDLRLPGLGDIEVKVPEEGVDPEDNRSSEQIAWHERARANGMRVATVDSVASAMSVATGWRQQQLRRTAA